MPNPTATTDGRPKLSRHETYMEGMCDLVILVGLDDVGVPPASEEAYELAENTIRRLRALWASADGGRHGGTMGPTENAAGGSDAPLLPGERTLIALCFSRMIRVQGNGPEWPYPEWMGRRWYNEGGFVKCTARSEVEVQDAA
jgi:hypothetical protein